MVPDVRYVRFDIQPVRHHFVVRGIHVVRIVFGHIELVQDVPKMFLLSPNMFVSIFSPDIRLVRHVVLDIRLVRDIPVGDVRLVDGVPKKINKFREQKLFVYKPVRDDILVVRTVRYPAVRIVVDHRRPVPVPVPDHKPVRMPDLLDHKPLSGMKIDFLNENKKKRLGEYHIRLYHLIIG